MLTAFLRIKKPTKQKSKERYIMNFHMMKAYITVRFCF